MSAPSRARSGSGLPMSAVKWGQGLVAGHGVAGSGDAAAADVAAETAVGARGVSLGDGRRARVRGVFEPGALEIVRGHHPAGVHEIVECSGAPLGEAVAAHEHGRGRSQAQDGPASLGQPVRVADRDLPGAAHGQVLEILGREGQPQAAAHVAVPVVHGHGGQGRAVLGSRADAGQGGVLGQPLLQGVQDRVRVPSPEVGLHHAHSVVVDLYAAGNVAPPGDDQAVEARLFEARRQAAADGPVADGPGQGRAGHDGPTARGGGVRAGQGAREDEQRQVRVGVLAGGKGAQIMPGQAAPAEEGAVQAVVRVLMGDGARRQVYAKNRAGPAESSAHGRNLSRTA